MRIHDQIRKWRGEKAVRARAVSDSEPYFRGSKINSFHDEKKKIVKLYDSMSGLHTMRQMIFNYMRQNEITHVVARYRKNESGGKGHPLGYSPDDKRIMRNRISAMRMMRVRYGMPMAFCDYQRPYWVDPKSSYIPDDQLGVAAKHLTFNVITMLMSATEHHRITDKMLRREHRGPWTTHLHHGDEAAASDACVRYVFYFAHDSDVVAFRFDHSDLASFAA